MLDGSSYPQNAVRSRPCTRSKGVHPTVPGRGPGARQTATAPRSQELGSAECGVRPREGRRDGVGSCQPWSKETLAHG